MLDAIIVGGGVISAFIARNLSRYKIDALVIEKENDVGNVTSMANSAIAHSGYDPVPGTKKARFNVEGNRMFKQTCEELDVEFIQSGSLTVALYDSQLPLLDDLAKRGKENGVETKLLSAEEVRAIEPNINPEVKAALLCPTAGVVNPFTLSSHAMENAIDNGVKIHLGEEVTNIEKIENGYRVTTNKTTYEAKVVINAAGLYSEEVAKMIEPIDWHITPRKGEYFVLDHFQKGFVNHVLFPLPSEKGKGILVSMTSSGDYIVGPSAEAVENKDDYSTDSPTLANVKKQGLDMVPSIPFNQQIRVFAGLRATPSTHDFIIEPSHKYKDFINVAGIESPGLASSPAIGRYVADELVRPLLNLEENPNYNPCVRKYVKPLEMSLEDRNALIKENPEYGQIICNCEKVSLGELKDALNRSLPCNTVKALKKRTRAGFGKCQGGFCQPKVLLLLSEYYKKSPLDVLYDKTGSNILDKEAK